MSIVTKKIGGRQYAYRAYRTGNRIIQEYLGPVTDPGIARKIQASTEKRRIPVKFYPLFWDTDPSRIDVHRQRTYIIERVLEMGDLDAFLWIQRRFPTDRILEVCDSSRKVSPKSRNFWNRWIGLLENNETLS
jgi:hypothetical protein